MSEKVIISGFRSRKEIAEILQVSERTLFKLLNTEYFIGKIPKNKKISPAHQRIIFDYFGITYE